MRNITQLILGQDYLNCMSNNKQAFHWILALLLSNATNFLKIDFLPHLIIRIRLFELLELIWVS